MARALKVCSTPGCPELVPAGRSRCYACARQADRARGTARQRGYGREHARRFRKAVLAANPLCTCRTPHGEPGTLGHHGGECLRPSTVADHYPRSKRELRALGLDEHDPRYGRGMCAPCHSWWTTQAQPGGWLSR